MHVGASQKMGYLSGGPWNKGSSALNPEVFVQVLGISELDMETSVTGNFGDLSELSFSNSCLPGEVMSWELF